ncbi:pilus assembly protein [Aerosticca soli]|uniref:Type IV fimbrial biogenesis protein PilY1 n=1 Tax=Aerosticca soli TaxID=2010829 RepID=A0A2Z6E5M2_9GAMM|nr:PilC/PilY family type IV pilus protein [Aerosticca soli]BBD80426.1 type IV fimbrial biogenesis protein PilY1 [Aerosticca soli]
MHLHRLMRRAVSVLGRLLGSSLLVLMLGFFIAPLAQATEVTIDPSPLIVQITLPPNMMLMLDDSGSMNYDFMPDWGYLADQSANGARNSNVNGIYYNPTILYTLPVHANGTPYPNSPGLTSAYKDAYLDTTHSQNITTYYDSADGSHTLYYYTNLPVSKTDLGPPIVRCATNYHENPADPTQCIRDPVAPTDTWKCNSGDYGPVSSMCRHRVWVEGTPVDTWYAANHVGMTCPGGTTLQADGLCHYPVAAKSLGCASGSLYLGVCVNWTYKSYFTYVTGPIGGYQVHYVASGTQCNLLFNAADQANCVNENDISGVAAPVGVKAGQNIANWYSYYRTRLLMAKTGLLRTFAGLDSKFRVGFGSINGQNNSNLPTLNATFGATNVKVAEVQPLGDGSSGTQKASFWNWVTSIAANGETPLRNALDAVGQYYKTDQPWTTMSSDPNYAENEHKELACRQSYTILTTDGFWNDDTAPSGIGDQDGTVGSAISNPNGNSYTYTPALPYTDLNLTPYLQTVNSSCDSGYTRTLVGSTYICKKGTNPTQTPFCSAGWTLTTNQGFCTQTVTPVGNSDTLADVAMKYWKADLRPSTANVVPTNTDDPAFWQHMVTFTMGMGFPPVGITPSTATVDQIFSWSNGGSPITNFSWPTPASNSKYNIADLAHAAVNGHGGFYSATDPESFVAGLTSALRRASSRVGTGASLAANSTQTQTGTVAYQAYYYTIKWTGDLKAFNINSGVIGSTPIWTASTGMPTAGSRHIWSYNGTDYMEFKVSADGSLPALASDQLNALGGSASAQADMINYLRGDSSKDMAHGGSFRTREVSLGDIVDSQPIYVAAPGLDLFGMQTFTGTASYGTFAVDQASRSPSVYVAANDGFLHAFDAGSGLETYAYLPGAVITSGLKDLANPAYGDTVSHEYFNDGELTVADAYFGSAWHTVLVGSTGKGTAKSVYALDVTDPTNIQFLWERSAGDGKTNSNYIGQMTGKPVIAQTADGVWSVLMGNGYNSAAGKAALLQFGLSDGTLDVHQTTDTTGLAAPAVWIGTLANGISTVAYAGDADGNVWSFTLNTGSTTATATPSSSGVKLFTATDSSNNAQPITAGMSIGKDPQSGNVWIFFGTGKYLSRDDLADMSTQTWYGLIVSSTDSTNHPAVDGTTHKDRSALAQRSITSETAGDANTLPGRTVTTLTDASNITGKAGWYIDLLSPTGVDGAAVQQGERIVTPNVLNGLLIGTTRIPKAADACNPSGKGWIMAIDPFTGTNPSAVFFDLNGSGNVDTGDLINDKPAAGIGFASLPNNPIFVGSHMLVSFDNGTNTSVNTFSPPTVSALQRVSWRELISP